MTSTVALNPLGMRNRRILDRSKPIKQRIPQKYTPRDEGWSFLITIGMTIKDTLAPMKHKSKMKSPYPSVSVIKGNTLARKQALNPVNMC